mmetsp:Transcript_25373/g.70080  ORF Transcript_25373/g.70080 Transcript_25373/m.70080 type:complete len:450 (-) Transcript_25373:1883-3232(-)
MRPLPLIDQPKPPGPEEGFSGRELHDEVDQCIRGEMDKAEEAPMIKRLNDFCERSTEPVGTTFLIHSYLPGITMKKLPDYSNIGPNNRSSERSQNSKKLRDWLAALRAAREAANNDCNHNNGRNDGRNGDYPVRHNNGDNDGDNGVRNLQAAADDDNNDATTNNNDQPFMRADSSVSRTLQYRNVSTPATHADARIAMEEYRLLGIKIRAEERMRQAEIQAEERMREVEQREATKRIEIKEREATNRMEIELQIEMEKSRRIEEQNAMYPNLTVPGGSHQLPAPTAQQHNRAALTLTGGAQPPALPAAVTQTLTGEATPAKIAPQSVKALASAKAATPAARPLAPPLATRPLTGDAAQANLAATPAKAPASSKATPSTKPKPPAPTAATEAPQSVKAAPPSATAPSTPSPKATPGAQDKAQTPASSASSSMGFSMSSLSLTPDSGHFRL